MATPRPARSLSRVEGCLDDNRAAEFATGALAMGEAAKVEAHLAACRDCRSLVAALAPAPGDDSGLDTAPWQVFGGAAAPSEPAGGFAPAFAVGDRIGRYIVLGRLGQGGMGVVLSAYDPQLDRKVAIKLLRTGTAIATAEARARMVREAKAIAQLSHPNVVAVYDVGMADPGDVYIAMEFVEGDTLTVWQRRWDRSWREVLDVFLQAGRGLSAAHGVGLLHRDFKPDNVLVGADGRVRVGDFGLARSLLGPEDPSQMATIVNALTGSLTATGAIVGTPRYMAPETLRGKDSDARSDQFSYCVALYETLWGQHPLDGETAQAMVDKGAVARPPPEGHKVSASIVRAVMRGLEDQPAKRFPSMAALIAELVPPPVRRPQRALVAIGAGLLAIGAAGAAVVSGASGEEPMPQGERQVLLVKIDQLEKQRDKLMAAITQLAEEKQVDQAQIEVLRNELKQKNEEIQELVVELGVVMGPPAKPPPPRVPPDTGRKVLEFVGTTSREFKNCIMEWAERNQGQDARLTAQVSVAPSGQGHSAIVRGVESEATRNCVTDRLNSLDFPAPGQVLRLEIAISFESGVIDVVAKALSAGPAGGLIDGARDRPRGRGAPGVVAPAGDPTKIDL